MSTKVSCLKNILKKFEEFKKSSPLLELYALRESCPRDKIPCFVVHMADHEQMRVGEGLFDEAFNVSWKSRNQQQALRILDLMARQGFSTWTNIIRLHCGSNRLEIAEGIFLSLKMKGSSVNIVAAKDILNSYVDMERYTEAYAFFQTVTNNLREYGKVDASFYTCMMIGLLKDNNVSEAFKLIGNVEEKNIKTEDYMYYAFFNWLCNNTLYKEAEEVFFRMKKCAVVPHIETYNGLLYGYLEMDDCEKADKHVKEMVQLGVPVTYRVVSYVVRKYKATEIQRFLDPFIGAELVEADIVSPVRNDWAKVKQWKKGSVFKQKDVDDGGNQS